MDNCLFLENELFRERKFQHLQTAGQPNFDVDLSSSLSAGHQRSRHQDGRDQEALLECGKGIEEVEEDQEAEDRDCSMKRGGQGRGVRVVIQISRSASGPSLAGRAACSYGGCLSFRSRRRAEGLRGHMNGGRESLVRVLDNDQGVPLPAILKGSNGGSLKERVGEDADFYHGGSGRSSKDDGRQVSR